MTARHFLDFEKPIAELEGKIEELRHLPDDGKINIAEEIEKVQAKTEKLLHQIYDHLTSWQKLQVARHPDRPHFSDFVKAEVAEFTPLAGDRTYAEDLAIRGGIGRFRGFSIMLIGHEKGRDTEDRVRHNFGMAMPEGYRKAQRLMRLAERFCLPVVTLVDTPGAYPGIGAEERGQAESIARCIETCLDLRTPLVTAILGEGGSGGAIALAAANKVLMMEHAVYSVISPEGCASILWRSADKAKEAAEALKLTAQDIHQLGVIDEIIPEPLGGAHRRPEEAIRGLGDGIEKAIRELVEEDGESLRIRRQEKFLEMGKKEIS
jgi:acetyl-CoA carboxylase carboxyl transferase subunit alpha